MSESGFDYVLPPSGDPFQQHLPPAAVVQSPLAGVELQAAALVGELAQAYLAAAVGQLMTTTMHNLAASTMPALVIGNYAPPLGYNSYGSRTATTEPKTLQEVHKIAQLTAYLEGWAERDPKTLIDEMILELPDEVPIHPQEDSPPTKPSRLELYFMSKVPGLTSADLDYHQTGALPPQDSIGCLRDKVRTKLFMSAIAETLEQMDATSQETIEVCDAGTGAIPVMAIYAALCSDRVRCTALELNPRSAQMARKVVEQFGLQDRITIVEADATKYVPTKPIDLLVSETMHSGLTAEPIVQILSNLQPHVKEDGVTLPNEVGVKAAILPCDDWINAQSHTKIMSVSHRVVSPEWRDVVRYVPGQPLDRIAIAFDTTTLPDGEYCVAVTSDVVIGSRVLQPYQSLITTPQYPMDRWRTLSRFTVRSGSMPNTELAVEYAPGETLVGRGHFRQPA